MFNSYVKLPEGKLFGKTSQQCIPKKRPWQFNIAMEHCPFKDDLPIKIRPHRFGGEGVLIGGQNSNTKCSMTFVNIAVAISALAGGGGPKNGFAPRPEYGGVFDIFRGFLGVWAQEGIEMEFWVILVAFRQWKNGQKWKKNIVHSKNLQGFWMPEHWKHCKNKCFGLTL